MDAKFSSALSALLRAGVSRDGQDLVTGQLDRAIDGLVDSGEPPYMPLNVAAGALAARLFAAQIVRLLYAVRRRDVQEARAVRESARTLAASGEILDQHRQAVRDALFEGEYRLNQLLFELLQEAREKHQETPAAAPGESSRRFLKMF